jgi:TIR domain
VTALSFPRYYLASSMSYSWEVFVSYRREDPVERWTQKVLAPAFKKWLPQYHKPARVFLDVDEEALPAGSEWAKVLGPALHQSCCLLTVFSPQYFDSEWCLAEFHTMLERQRKTGSVLLLPLHFSDGDYFSAEANALQKAFVPVEKYNTFSSLAQAEASAGFMRMVKQICQLVHARLDAAPAWDPSWPLRQPQPGDEAVVAKPTY